MLINFKSWLCGARNFEEENGNNYGREKIEEKIKYDKKEYVSIRPTNIWQSLEREIKSPLRIETTPRVFGVFVWVCMGEGVEGKNWKTHDSCAKFKW